ncbi:hypothetical protein HYQ46_009044 [Verticillium longisporum]|uniref:Uncharacterized protein n=1 Tax=Verticillium longisporum TaxID=100787 RepID=A0A0G4N793_VERLO|nr:hypothetical protein HYQ46_009044 [Verticillium longisporum]CRK42491.1 hypothetical protein BN1708_008777 [Verticillium longisporum]
MSESDGISNGFYASAAFVGRLGLLVHQVLECCARFSWASFLLQLNVLLGEIMQEPHPDEALNVLGADVLHEASEADEHEEPVNRILE